MAAQDSINLSYLKIPYKHIMNNGEVKKTTTTRAHHRYVKKSTLYWSVGLTAVVAAILLTINGILVYYIASGDKECKLVVPEGYVLSPKDGLRVSDNLKDGMQVSDQPKGIVQVYLQHPKDDVHASAQPKDDMQVSDQTTTSETKVTASHEVTTTSTKTYSTDRPVTTSHEQTTTATMTSSTGRPDCPSGWILTHGSSCYSISVDIQSWQKATDSCVRKGGYLVEINDAAENKFLVTQLQLLDDKESYWIGLTDEDHEDIWVWSNSSITITTKIYSSWHHGQPDNGRKSEHCAELMEELPLSWNDDQCKNSHYYICERARR